MHINQKLPSIYAAVLNSPVSHVSERLKGASARRFKRGQFDMKGMVHSDNGFIRKPFALNAWHLSVALSAKLARSGRVGSRWALGALGAWHLSVR